MSLKITKESIIELLGAPTDVSFTSAVSIPQISFELYRETAIVVILGSNLYQSDDSVGILNHNQAIEAGLAIRISKFMGSVLALLLDKVRSHGEVIMALNRCIIESSINLRFFCEKASEQDFDDFIKTGLKPEKDLHAAVQENITKRGIILPIEERMLKSLERVFRISGISEINNLDLKRQRKKYREILKSLGMESQYSVLQGVPSHSIHGTWVDLITHHLEEVQGGFIPNPDSVPPDTRLLCPINHFVLLAIRSYICKYFPVTHEAIEILINRLDNLIERNIRVDSMHEAKL